MALERIGLGAILEFAVGKAIGNMKLAKKNLASLERSFADVGRGVTRMRTGIERVGTAAVSVAKPLGLAAAAGTVAAVRAFSRFETGLAKIGTLLSGTEEATTRFSAGLTGLSVKFGQAMDTTSEGMFQAISASVEAGDALRFMDEANKSAVAGFTDTTTSVNALTNVVNAYGESMAETGDVVARAKRINDAIFIANREGKCIDGDSRVLLSDGRYAPIKDLHDGVEVMAWDGRDWCFKPRVAKWWDQGEKDCTKVRTRSGRQIVTTPEHPYLTPRGWRRVDELKVGNAVAVPQFLPVFGEDNPGLERAELLGYLLGDGCLTQSTPTFTFGESSDGEEAGRRVFNLAKAIGLQPTLTTPDNRAPRVNLSAGKRGGRHTNPLVTWLKELGCWGKDAHGKAIPDVCFTWNREAIALLLRGLFTTDGWISLNERKNGAGRRVAIGYSTVSERLARDVATLLSRFGIHAKLRHRSNRYDGFWSLEILRLAEAGVFLREIGIAKNTGKVEEATRWTAWSEEHRSVTKLEDPESPIRFEVIAELKDVGKRHVYDLTVDDLHNFVAEDIVAHNTTFAEIAQSIGVVASTAALAGVEIEEVTSAIATMTKAGVNTQMSTIALNQAILGFAKPTKQAREEAAKYGIELSLATLRNKGLQASLAEVQEKLGDNDEALVKIFGNVRAFRAAAILAGKGAGTFAETLAMSRAEVGITDQKFQDVSQTTAFQFRRGMQAIAAAVRQVGAAFVEVFGTRFFGRLADNITTRLGQIKAIAVAFFTGFRDGIDRVRAGFAFLKPALDSLGVSLGKIGGEELAARIGKVAGAIAGIAVPALLASVVLKPLIGIIGGVASMSLGAATSIMGIVNASKVLAPMLAGPLGIALAGVALIVAAVARNSGGLRDAFGQLMDTLKSLWDAIQPLVTTLTDTLVPIFNTLIDLVGTILAPVIRIVNDLFKALVPIIEVVGGILGTIAGAVGKLAEVLGGVLQPVLEAVGAILEVTIRPVLMMIKWLFEKIIALGRALGKVLNRSFSSIARNASMAEENLRGLLGVMNTVRGVGKQAGLITEKRDQEKRSEAQMRALGVGEKVTVKFPKATGGIMKSLDASIAGLEKERTEEKKREEERRRKRCLNVSSKLKVDGSEMTVAESRAKLEITERAGAGLTPYQRRQVIERGAVSAAVTRG
jgi:intein/homing endonuclease